MGYPFYSSVDGTRTDIYGHDAVPMHGLDRWHITDAIRFKDALKVEIQQIGHDGKRLFERADDVASTAWWYQSEPHSTFHLLPDRDARQPR